MPGPEIESLVDAARAAQAQIVLPGLRITTLRQLLPDHWLLR
ncbi:MAG: hypothetical protein M5U32_02740 [Myxococcota bacterium]|nr:hypothetical protein [Myxococcota bacterium]